MHNCTVEIKLFYNNMIANLHHYASRFMKNYPLSQVFEIYVIAHNLMHENFYGFSCQGNIFHSIYLFYWHLLMLCFKGNTRKVYFVEVEMLKWLIL